MPWEILAEVCSADQLAKVSKFALQSFVEERQAMTWCVSCCVVPFLAVLCCAVRCNVIIAFTPRAACYRGWYPPTMPHDWCGCRGTPAWKLLLWQVPDLSLFY